MSNRIAHSELTRRLKDLQQFNSTSEPLRQAIMNLTVLTRDGVYPETADLPMQVTDSNTIEWGEKKIFQRPTITEGLKSGFKFGASSERELVGVNKDLVAVTRLALAYSKQDFCVYDGIRTVKEQQNHVRNGTSRTMQSKHLQGLAVDLVPWINGAPKWDWDGCFEIAVAFDRAATELGLASKIIWGAAWDRRLSDYGGDVNEYRKEVEAYKKRHEGSDFIDGPHFEIHP